MRLRVSQYAEMILRAAVDNNITPKPQNPMIATFETIEQNSEIIDYILVKGTDDQSQEVRNYSRFCFMLYRKLLPDNSSVLLMHGIP